MDEKEKLGKLSSATCEIKYLTQIGNVYLDAYEEIPELSPLSIVFEEINNRIKVIEDLIFVYQ